MRFHRNVTFVCVVSIACAGCAGQSKFFTVGPTVGQLKTSLSHLEFENDELKKRTAKLEQENRSIENRLVQEQLDNGDLTARLDDARNLLRDRGLESDVRLGSSRRTEGEDATEDVEPPRTRTLPAGRSTRQRRKPPFAHISGTDTARPPLKDDDSADESSKRPDSKTSRSRRREDDLDRHSFHNDQLRWLPVAEADGDSSIEIR